MPSIGYYEFESNEKEEMAVVAGYPDRVWEKGEVSVKNQNLMYADKGCVKPQGKTTDDTALFVYNKLQIMTSQGQSGSPLQIVIP